MKNNFKRLAIVFILCLASTFSAFSALAFPQSQNTMAVKNSLDYDLLLHYSSQALTPSTDEKDLDYCYTVIQDIITKSEKTYKSLDKNKYPKADLLLQALHENLREYKINACTIDDMSKGFFNCVTSALLYSLLCIRNSISIEACYTSEHCFVLAQGVEVQTTINHGYNPGSDKEIYNKLGEVIGTSYVDSNKEDYSKTDMLGLIALCATNLTSYYLDSGDYQNALNISTKAYRIKNFEVSQRSLYTSYNNAVVELQKNDLANASSLIKQAYKNYSQVEGFDDLLTLVQQNYTIEFLKRNEYSNAFSQITYLEDDSERTRELKISAFNNLLNQIVANYGFESALEVFELTKKNFEQTKLKEIGSYIYEGVLVKWANEGKPKLIIENRNNGYLDIQKVNDLTSAAYGNHLINLSKEQGYINAYLEYQRISLVYKSENLKKIGNTLETNAVIEVHNKFVESFNNKNKVEAKKIIENGLQLFGNNEQLLKDYEAVKAY